MKLSEIARRIDCRMDSTRDVEIVRIAGIEEAGPGDLTFISNRKYIRYLKTTRAAAIILDNDIPPVAIPSLRTEDPYLAFAHALEIFHVPLRQNPGIHPDAVIHENEPGSVQKSVRGESQIGVHIHLRRFAVA